MRRKFLLLSALFALALAMPVRLQASDEGQRYHALVTQLASPEMEGRGIQTQGIIRARDLLVSQLQALGLEPVVVSNPHATYTQPLEMAAGVTVTQQSLAMGKDAPLTAGKDYSVMGFSASGDLAGELVFAGFGIVNPDKQYDNFAVLPKDALKGKVAVVYRYEPMDAAGKSLWATEGKAELGAWTKHSDLTAKARHAAEHGAKAMIFIDPPLQDAKSLKRTDQSAMAPVGIPVLQVTPAVLARMLELAGQADAGKAMVTLQEQASRNEPVPDAFKGVTLAGSVEIDRPKVTVHNIAALLPGAGELKDQVIVIGAHYDHLGHGEPGSLAPDSRDIHPGADDNASGTAGVVILAQRLKELAKENADAPRRSVLLCLFTGEERGLVGSSHLVKNLDQLGLKPTQIVAMINMDMIGRMTENKLTVGGVDTTPRWKGLVEPAAKELGLSLQTWGSGMGPSDHTSFYLAKVPVLFLFTGTHADYHKPSDTAEKINVQGALQVLDVVQRVTQAIWRDATPLEFKETPGHQMAMGPGEGSGAMLGIVPNYGSDEGKGCLIDGAQPGTPADKAGLKPGDLITRWNDQPVTNLMDLTSQLRKSKPGDVVKLEVVRSGQKLTLEAKLSRRGG